MRCTSSLLSPAGQSPVAAWLLLSGGPGSVCALQSWSVTQSQREALSVLTTHPPCLLPLPFPLSPSPSPLPPLLVPTAVQHEKMKFLCIATKTSVEVYAWAQKPYSKFMQYKSFPDIQQRPILVDMVCETSSKTKVLYASQTGQWQRELV